MKKKKMIDWHSDQRVKALQVELQKWMETHDLTHDTQWWTADNFDGSKLAEFEEQPQLVLTFEGDLNNLFWCPRDDDWHHDRRNEFEKIVERHGYWYEFEDCVTMTFMPLEN